LRIFAERNDEISYLGATIHQLAEKVTPALPPFGRGDQGKALGAVLEERIR
jgi:hypothetical protein